MIAPYLRALEEESIYILREVAAEFARPALLYSIGKDSSVLLRLAMKAFHPAKPPFPLLHVDTSFKFREMVEFRDETARRLGLRLIVHTNQQALEAGAGPYAMGTQKCCHFLKTRALLDALALNEIDAAIGGARREEEKSRAKERIYSFRDSFGQWDPKNQRPELWRLYNGRIEKGESIRVFPLSNWTELDVWKYIQREGIPIPDLYFAKPRPVVDRDGMWIMVDDDRLPLREGEEPVMRSVRFRTLGCYPLTGAVESTADTMADLVSEMEGAKYSERSGRLIDGEGGSESMEGKKKEGYF